MEFYGVAVVVVHCPFLWPFTGFPHLEHVYVFVLQVTAVAAVADFRPCYETLRATTKLINSSICGLALWNKITI